MSHHLLIGIRVFVYILAADVLECEFNLRYFVLRVENGTNIPFADLDIYL